MPRTGRPPKPLEQIRATARNQTHKADGRPLPAVREVVAKTVVVPAEPDGLAARGSEEWVNIWTAGANWLHPTEDYHWVEMIAHAYDEIAHFRSVIAEDGLTQRGSMGQMVAHPLIGEIRRAEATIMKALSTLGFSPSDRARLGLAEIKAQSKLQDMMAKAGQ